MTIARLISPDTRAGLLIAIGSALVLAPGLIGLEADAIVTGVLVGTIAVGLGLAGTGTYGRGTIPITAHMSYDQGLAAGLVLAALAFLVAGAPAAAGFFALVGLAQGTVSAITSYSISARTA